MFKLNEYVVYKKDVCIVKEIKKNQFHNKDYYILEPINDKTLKINIPTDNKDLRNLITKEELTKIINKIPKVNIITTDDKLIEMEYKELLKSNNLLDLVKIIKTSYLRNKKRLDNNKKVGEKDQNYFELAEKYLYTEFSIVLNLTYNDTKKYIINEISKLDNKIKTQIKIIRKINLCF